MKNDQILVNPVLIQAQMNALTNQRNSAQNEAVNLAGQNAVLEADKLALHEEIKVLTEKLSEQEAVALQQAATPPTPKRARSAKSLPAIQSQPNTRHSQREPPCRQKYS